MAFTPETAEKLWLAERYMRETTEASTEAERATNCGRILSLLRETIAVVERHVPGYVSPTYSPRYDPAEEEEEIEPDDKDKEGEGYESPRYSPSSPRYDPAVAHEPMDEGDVIDLTKD